MSFNKWMDRFVKVLIQSGMPVPQAHRYWREYRQDARDYFEYGLTPEEAATAELMPF